MTDNRLPYFGYTWDDPRTCKRCGGVRISPRSEICEDCREADTELNLASAADAASDTDVADLHDLEESRRRDKEATQGMLSRINSLEMVARRGTVLTPYGWREPRKEQI